MTENNPDAQLCRLLRCQFVLCFLIVMVKFQSSWYNLSAGGGLRPRFPQLTLI